MRIARIFYTSMFSLHSYPSKSEEVLITALPKDKLTYTTFFNYETEAKKLARQLRSIDLKNIDYIGKFIKRSHKNEKSISNRCWWNKNL